MTHEQAINWIKGHHDLDLDTLDATSSAMAIEALEKQIPKKPIKGCCANCGIDFDVWNYCPVCGQKLDWSE